MKFSDTLYKFNRDEMDQSVLIWLCVSPQILTGLLFCCEMSIRLPWYFLFCAYQVYRQ